MPIKIFIEPTSSSRGFSPDFVDILRQAFKDWQAKAAGLISVEFASDKSAAQIVATWTDSKDDTFFMSEGGHTVILAADQGVARAQIKILTLPPEGEKEIGSDRMYWVALHEAGHALGLTGHSNKRDDIMYGTITPRPISPSISERDAATLIALYSQSESVMSSNRIDINKLGVQGNADTPEVMALKLSNEGLQALKAQKFDLAVLKLEEAHKLDPKASVVSSNLGAIYANFGSMAAMTFNMPVAQNYFKKAIPLLEAGGNNEALRQVLTNYLKILKVTNNTSEIKLIEARLAKLKD